MQIIPSLLFGISASLDSLLVGITFGIRGAHIRFWQNLLISFITLLGTCLSVGLGAQLVTLLPASLWKLTGSLILILFGIYYIIKFMIAVLKKYRQKKQLTAAQLSEVQNKSPMAMTVSGACALGCALSANNIGIGLSASIAGLSLPPTAVITLFFSLAFLAFGNYLGRCRLLKFTDHAADLISGLLLVCLGVLEYMG